MKSRQKKIMAVAAALLSVLAAAGFFYQTFTISSYESLVFNQVTGVTISPVPTAANPGTNCRSANTACAIQNVGTGSHWLTYCIASGTVNAIAIELEGSNDTSNPPTNWMQISNQDTSLTGTSGCGVLEAAGYFQYLRVNLSVFNGVSPELNAWYSGIGTAIPGGGLVAGNKSSQPVTTVPAGIITATALKTTAQAICTTNCAVFTVNAYNPNASPVFVLITNVQQGPGVSATAAWGIPANQSRDILLGPGVLAGLGGNSLMTCATAVGGAGDPATGCVVSVTFKPYQSINAQVGSNGVPISVKQQQPN